MNLPNPAEVDCDNIARPTVDELSAEDHQAYEAFVKEREAVKRRTYDAKPKKMKMHVDGFYLTSIEIGRVASPRIRKWSFFRTRTSKLR